MVLKAKDLEKENADQNIDQHHKFARKVAAESITLLKNDNSVLPVTKDKYKKVAVIGEFAVNPRYQGNGSSEVKPTMIDKILDILNDEYGQIFEITYSQGYSLTDDDNYSMVKEAAETAKDQTESEPDAPAETAQAETQTETSEKE